MDPLKLRFRRRRETPLAALAPAALLAAALALPAAAEPAPPPQTPAGPARPAAGAPAAASAEETFYESIDVDVVNVEVVATDRSGRPVAGLAQRDFELYEDGRPVAISNFFHSAGEPPAPAQSAAAAAAPDRRMDRPAAKPPDQVLNFAVFVDNENLTLNARRPVLGALQDFLRAHVGTGDHVILASYDGGIKVSQPAAGDPQAIDAAMTRLMTTVTHGGLAVRRQGRSGGCSRTSPRGPLPTPPSSSASSTRTSRSAARSTWSAAAAASPCSPTSSPRSPACRAGRRWSW